MRAVFCGSAMCAIALGLAAAASAQQTATYRVEAGETDNITLSLCSPQVEVVVDGDGDTDLDFVIKDNNGRVVHEDRDGTDLTFANLRPQLPSSGCVQYSLDVINLGNVFNRYSVQMTGSGRRVTTTADQRNRQVSIHNHTAEAFVALHWSNTADDVWGPNRLAATMRARTNRTVDVDDGSGACRFDVMVRTAGGREYTKRDVDVCSVSTIEFGTEITH